MKATREALLAGIDMCRPGKRVGDIGHAVQTHAEGHGYSVVREFVGHGIGTSLHEEPQVPNYGPPGRRERLVPGHVPGHRADGQRRAARGRGARRRLDGGDPGPAACPLTSSSSVAVTPLGPWILSEPYPYASEAEAANA